MSNQGIPHLQKLLAHHGASRGQALHVTASFAAAGPLLQQALPTGRRLVVADAVTAPLAGASLAEALGADLVVVPPRSAGVVVAGQEEMQALTLRLQDCGAVAAVAVGAGTINDLTKFACHQAGLPAAVVGTAPSMNGYTSACAALLDKGVKVTLPCAPPRIAILPVDLLQTAPSRMAAAGFADLRSRPVSSADWYVSYCLLATHHDAEALTLFDVADDLGSAAVEGLSTRTPEALASLGAGLLLSGLAMDIAGTSAPSSGGEHLVSHYLDMCHYALGGPHDLHGCQVGVATVAMAHLYARLLQLSPADLTPATPAPWTAVAPDLARHFGPLWPAVEPVAQAVHGDAGQTCERITRLQQHWPGLVAELQHVLGPDPTSTRDLLRVGAPVRFSDLGVDRAGARAALLQARYVRQRYTVLDLAADLGRLEPWVDELLAAGVL